MTEAERDWHCVAGGKGDPVILLPGWPETKATNVNVVKIPDCGHFIPEEKPDAATKMLIEFLR